MNKVFELNHPLIQHKLTHIRKKSTKPKEFREYLDEISTLIAYEVFKNLKLKSIKIETPITKTIGKEVADSVNLFPILRAGIGMVEGFTNMMPTAKIGHIGIYRDKKTLEPKQYLFKYPHNGDKSKSKLNIILDPMMATGGSVIEAIETLHKKGFTNNVKLAVIVSSRYAINRIQKQYPNIEIYVASIDEKLNEHGYIEPGLGDAGDRIFGTK